MENKLVAKYQLNFTITLISGLHIGDSKETVQIGGIDNPVIRRRDNRQPYIPGSSLKGKIRSLMEQLEGKNIGGSEYVAKYFGTHRLDEKKDEKQIPSRLIFRDIYLNKETVTLLESNQNLDSLFTEAKFENSVDRFTAKANPRPLERIPASAVFEGSILLNEFSEGPNKNEMKSFIEKGFTLINNDYLGGSGSRGSGQVDIVIINENNEPIKLL